MINSGWEVGARQVARNLLADVCAIVALLAVFLAMWVH